MQAFDGVTGIVAQGSGLRDYLFLMDKKISATDAKLKVCCSGCHNMKAEKAKTDTKLIVSYVCIPSYRKLTC